MHLQKSLTKGTGGPMSMQSQTNGKERNWMWWDHDLPVISDLQVSTEATKSASEISCIGPIRQVPKKEIPWVFVKWNKNHGMMDLPFSIIMVTFHSMGKKPICFISMLKEPVLEFMVLFKFVSRMARAAIWGGWLESPNPLWSLTPQNHWSQRNRAPVLSETFRSEV